MLYIVSRSLQIPTIWYIIRCNQLISGEYRRRCMRLIGHGLLGVVVYPFLSNPIPKLYKPIFFLEDTWSLEYECDMLKRRSWDSLPLPNRFQNVRYENSKVWISISQILITGDKHNSRLNEYFLWRQVGQRSHKLFNHPKMTRVSRWPRCWIYIVIACCSRGLSGHGQ